MSQEMRVLLALTREMREARRGFEVAEKSQNGSWVKWLLGILAVLVAAGVLSSVRTYGNVQALTTDLGLFRVEVQRQFDRQTRDIDQLEAKIDGQMRSGGGG